MPSRALLLAVLLALPAAVHAQERESEEPWRILPLPQASLVLARDGSLVGEIGRARRVSVPLRTLPKYLPQAFIAVEDKRFYQHDGVDLIGVAAAVKDAVTGDLRGASTITQLVVGNMHPEIIDRSDMSLGRKLREQQAAREMERHYSKEEILETFLNLIDFGHGWRGVEMAARHYFGKGAARLTLAEAATLAALPKGPAVYDPIAHPDRARSRRNLVLDLMAEQGYVTAAQAAAAKRQPLKLAPNAGYGVRAPYFVDVVRAQAERAGIPVTEGGYRIRTTLDPLLQRAAEEALAAELKAIESRPGYRHLKYAGHPPGRTDYLQGAVVVLDPTSGHVRALVGGRDYGESQFNRAVNALRQPGSAFKPFVYATAIADSLPPNTVVADTAIAIPMSDGTTYRPQNSDHRYLGAMTMREALTHSRNSVAVQLGMTLGLPEVIGTARAMGIDTPIAPYPSSAIGASAVRPLDLVAAYLPLDMLGLRIEPRFVQRIESAAGRTVWTAPPAAARIVLDPHVAFIVRDMMRDVVARGTATSVRRYLPDWVPVAGKTGTTNDNTDVWFVGMTPELVAGVWVGFDRPKTITPGAAGGTLAAPVFGRIARAYYAAHPETRGWTAPQGLVTAELDRATGQPATPFTPAERRYVEYFLPGTEPGAVSAWRLFQWGPIGPP
ncbi:MAG TPA: PBP1A family penicillin-binding protein [Gemmatimonadaceae bacterium]|nr:PBP1A family penicillin-binding protein [Gemmatimonadaceae bacterium]